MVKCMAAQGAKCSPLMEIMDKECLKKMVNDWQKGLPNNNFKIKVKYPNLYPNFLKMF